MQTQAISVLVLAVALAACQSRDSGRAAEPAATRPAATPNVSASPFGVLGGDSVRQYTLVNPQGTEVRAIDYGATITVVRTADRSGQLDDIVFGYDSLPGYLAGDAYFGAIAGRYANRIAHARFTLDGRTYTLAANNGPNALHGGRRGFDKVLWRGEPFTHGDTVGVTFRYTSPNGEEGYPGTLQTAVTYSLTPANALIVDFEATTDRATPINLTQHSYWNLHGGGRGTILDHVLQLDASATTPVDSTLIPTGEMAPVAGTPFDFRTPARIGARIDESNPQLGYGRGYDHNWVLDRTGPGVVHAARLVDSTSGRTLDVATTEPGIQFYSGNFLDGTMRGKGGVTYAHRGALALETQHFPDSPNHPNFPSTVLRPGNTYRSRTSFTFGTLQQ